MNEIYPMWVAAHGIMIVTPVNWYQVSSPLKLMMDRLVCADGGNPDPTRTQGKDAELAKRDRARQAGTIRAISPAGCSRWWCMATSKASRTCGAASPTGSASCISRPAGPAAELDRYIGYWKPYATSHDELDADTAMQEEVRNAARTLHRGGAQQARRQTRHRRRESARAAAEIVARTRAGALDADDG